MASSSIVQRLSTAVKEAIQKIKKPWQFTGPTSSPEYLESVPGALEYRLHAPATPAIKASVPGAETDRVLNIVYYTRESRRAPYTHTSKVMDPTLPMNAENLTPSPPAYTSGYKVHIDDTPGDGYQK